MATDVFTFTPPAPPARRMLVNIPHAGTEVPEDIAAEFASEDIAALPMTDWHVDKLYDFLPAMGVGTLAARYSRFVVDLNRPPVAQALYPGRFETSLVATETFRGDPVYRSPPDKAEVARRRQLYHLPYHEQLLARIESALEALGGGQLVLIDAHSVASAASKLHGELTDHIYLGDRDGTTCPSWLTDFVAEAFEARGYRVVRNSPYKGGYVTAHYGAFDNVAALQIEMCQRVYMDESDPAGAPAHERFGPFRQTLQDVFGDLLAEIGRRRD